MFFFAILLGISLLLIVRHLCSYHPLPPVKSPRLPKEDIPKLTSYGYGEHTFKARSFKEAQMMMEYFDKSDAEKARQAALIKYQHCHLWDHKEMKCRRCGMTMSEYRSKPYYEQKRCPDARIEDFLTV